MGKKIYLEEEDCALLQLFADGLTYDEVSVRFGKSRRHIEDRISDIRKDLKATNTTHAVAIAMREGFLSPKIIIAFNESFPTANDTHVITSFDATQSSVVVVIRNQSSLKSDSVSLDMCEAQRIGLINIDSLIPYCK